MEKRLIQRSSLNRRRFLHSIAAVSACSVVPGLSAAGKQIDRNEPTATWEQVAQRASTIPRLRTLLILHEGQEVLGLNHNSSSLEVSANVKSISKTLVATLTGVAIDRGLVDGVDMTLAEAAPQLLPAGRAAIVSNITIGNLLSMQAGLQRTSGPLYSGWVNSSNWIEYVLSREQIAEPGGRMLYSTGSYHVLGAVLAERAGESLLELARGWLGEPLGITFDPWTRDPQGYYLGGNEMSLSPRALARIAELYRNTGVINGIRVLSEAWIAQAWDPRTRSPWSGHNYGYGWFLSQVEGERVAYGRGYGGQLIYCMPTRALTVVMLSDTRSPAHSGGYIDTLHGPFAESIVPTSRLV